MDFETDHVALTLKLKRLVIAGWTGRDEAAVRAHIEELAELGVPAPSSIPLYYAVSPDLMTGSEQLQVLGAETSGEAEPLIARVGGALWLGLGSDHTCRGLEAHSVAHAKQACGKPVALRLWRLDDLASTEAMELRSWIDEGAGWVPYQEGPLTAIRPLGELIEGAALAEGEAMMCGTLPAIGGVRPARRFRMALSDPETGRMIEHAYEIADMPVVA